MRHHANLEACNIHYARRDDSELAIDKLAFLGNAEIDDIAFDLIEPDEHCNWLNQSSSDFDTLIPVATRSTMQAGLGEQERAIFKLYAPGVMTGRDEWVYDFEVPNLRNKALFFADHYNELLVNGSQTRDAVIKWSRDLRNELRRGRHIVYSEGERIQSLYRPYTSKWYCANFTMNDVLTGNHRAMFGLDLKQDNPVIVIKGPAAEDFSVLATNKLVDYKCGFTGNGGTFCMPLYRYTEDGERVSNITEWGIDHINGHYRQEWGDDFQELAGEDGITAEQIFAYTYAVLHNPAYRHEYAVDLLREFPRPPLYPDFHHWAEMGQRLLDLHIGFESAEPYPLERHDRENVDPKRAMLRADKSGGTITLDERTTLSGVPEKAWEYRLGNRSALEWVLDQYKEKKPKDPTIREKFNTYRFSDHKEEVIDLLHRVCTVSAATMEIVDSMAQHENVSQSTGDPCPLTRTSSP